LSLAEVAVLLTIIAKMKILVEEKALRVESYVVNWHSHSFWQLDYYPRILEGELSLINKTRQIKSDEVYLIPPEVEHKVEVKNPLSDYSIKFDSDDPDFKYISPHVISFTEHEDIFRILFTEKQDEDDIDIRIKENYISILLLRILKKETILPEYSNIKDTRIKNVVVFIRTNLLKKLNIDILAEKANISKYHFIKLFQKETGATPFQYIQNLKLEKALNLLRFSDYNISQISETLSFPDIQTFSRAFKSKTGISPLAYRKSIAVPGKCH